MSIASSDLREFRVRVGSQPLVELFVAMRNGDPASTLLVIHGGPDWDHTYLREPLVRLAPGRRIVFVDLRGCGRSTRGFPVRCYTPEQAVGDLVTLIGRLGSAPVDVLGFSYGGALAQLLAGMAPHLVGRLVIASSSVLPIPSGAFDGWTERDERLALCPPPGAYGGGEWDPERTRRDAVNAAFLNVWRWDAVPDYLARIDQIRFSAEWAQARCAGTLPPARPQHAVPMLTTIGKRLLLLHGRHDMIFPAALAEEAADLIPKARAVILAESGHMAHIDEPGAWLQSVAGFLEVSAE